MPYNQSAVQHTHAIFPELSSPRVAAMLQPLPLEEKLKLEVQKSGLTELLWKSDTPVSNAGAELKKATKRLPADVMQTAVDAVESELADFPSKRVKLRAAC